MERRKAARAGGRARHPKVLQPGPLQSQGRGAGRPHGGGESHTRLTAQWVHGCHVSGQPLSLQLWVGATPRAFLGVNSRRRVIPAGTSCPAVSSSLS